MGAWEFLDEIEEDVEDGAKALGRGMGKVADEAAHVVGDGLDALGLHAAAEAVDDFGDTVADTLGAQVGEARLGETEDPAKLVHGDGDGLKKTVEHLGKFAAAFGKTADGLKGIDSGHWTGTAADAFRAQYQQHPAQWSDAAQACQKAATAMASFAAAVLLAQAQAGEAVKLYNQAKQASAQARAAYNQQVSTYNDQVNRYNWALTAGTDPGQSPAKPGDFTDPGAEIAQRAQQLLTDARAQRNAEGDRAAAAMAAATATAPAAPRFTQRLLDDAGDLVQEGMDGVVHFYGGMAKGVGGILKFGRSVNPLDPYNLTHPAEYVAGLSGTAAGLLHTVNHPMDLVEGMVGDGWGSDPFEAMGKLVPNVALGLATDGAGGAAEAAGERLAVGVGEDAAEQAGLAAGRTGAADAGALGERTAGYADDFGSFGDDVASAGEDFGPQGSTLPEEPPPAYYEKPEISDPLGHIDESGHDYSDPLGTHADDVPGEHSSPLDDTATPDDLHQDHEHPGSGDVPPSDPVPLPDYSGDPNFRRQMEIMPRSVSVSGLHLRAQEIQKIVADHPELSGIPEADLVSIRGYTSNSFYEDMNKGLREGDPELIDRYDAHSRSLTSGLNQMSGYEGNVSRGIHLTGEKLFDVINRYEPGTVVEEPAFFSTDRIKSFPGNVQFEVESVTGRDVQSLSTHSDSEAEVLFPPGTKFKVLNRAYDSASEQWWIKLQDVS